MSSEIELLKRKLERERRARTQAESLLEEKSLALFRAKEQAEQIARMRAYLLTNMSHELNTPLNAMIGFSEIIAAGVAGPLNEMQEDFFQQIVEAGRQLHQLFENIMDTAKLELGGEMIEPSEMNVAETLSAIMDRASECADGKQVRIRLATDPGIDIMNADPAALDRMVGCLLDNAIKFSTEGADVNIEVRRSSMGEVRIDVIDGGPGIPPDQIELVVLPFYQADGGYDRAHQGSGLGLAIAKGLAEAHGGRLSLVSVVGSGTRASLFLPDRPSAEAVA